jgi:hypothetical protein
MDVDQSALRIKQTMDTALKEQKGCLIGRWGTIEFEMLWYTGPSLYEEKRYILERNAGVFPLTKKEDVEIWAKEYVKAIQHADCLATGWYAPMKKAEQQFLEFVKWKGEQIVLRGLEPYYVEPELRWTNLLQGKRVCVVTSFTETGKKQVAKGASAIWGVKGAGIKGESVWPSGIQWSWVQTGYAPVLAQGKCTWSEASGEDIQCWQDAVKYMVDEVLKTNAEIVLIGCGGLGMLVGTQLKSKGKVCVVMGGATQVFLGICGQRWATHDFISKLWNKEWVYPSENETPGGAKEVEGGCYWN